MTFVARPEQVLRDAFGRIATDLRISLTDRCSLRCTYCMPAEGLDWLTRTDRLSDDEIVRLAAVFVDLGVTSVRLTGGEPLVHRSVVDVVGRLAQLDPASRAVADHERDQPRPLRRAAAGRRPRPGQRLRRHPRPGTIHANSPGATGSPMCSTASLPPRPPGCAR